MQPLFPMLMQFYSIPFELRWHFATNHVLQRCVYSMPRSMKWCVQHRPDWWLNHTECSLILFLKKIPKRILLDPLLQDPSIDDIHLVLASTLYRGAHDLYRYFNMIWRKIHFFFIMPVNHCTQKHLITGQSKPPWRELKWNCEAPY